MPRWGYTIKVNQISIKTYFIFKIFFKAVKCPRNEEFHVNGICERDCDNTFDYCSKECKPAGCYCKANYVRHEGKCIKENQCPCKNKYNIS